jgi:hypothetical protein
MTDKLLCHKNNIKMHMKQRRQKRHQNLFKELYPSFMMQYRQGQQHTHQNNTPHNSRKTIHHNRLNLNQSSQM